MNIWIKGPQLTDLDYLNDTNSAGYKQPIKTLDCKISRFYWSDLGGSTNEMPGFRIFQIVTSSRLRALHQYIMGYILIEIMILFDIFIFLTHKMLWLPIPNWHQYNLRLSFPMPHLAHYSSKPNQDIKYH